MATRWLEKFREYEGLKEIPGAEVHPKIAEWFTLCGLPNANDDTTPWCAVCVSGVLEEAGIEGPRSASSQAFLNWGEECEAEPGAIIVFRGHVAVITAVEPELMIIGGNQSDGICEQPARYYGEPVEGGFRWPERELEEAEDQLVEPEEEDPAPDVTALQKDLPSIEEVRDMFEEQKVLIKHLYSEIMDTDTARYNEIITRLDDILKWIETRRAPNPATTRLSPKRRKKKKLI